mmetsp:Transcript_125660/g.222656  ORF Transcript_125660/g.222656 Transcript_125660/m.222656 type:complete len:195 (+) Transcript_125660:127-711(+)
METSLEGITSTTFDLPADVNSHDYRRVAAGMPEVCQIMGREHLDFDEARLQLLRSRMEQIGADPSGMPLDPKAFTFDQVPKPACRRASSGPVQSRPSELFSSMARVMRRVQTDPLPFADVEMGFSDFPWSCKCGHLQVLADACHYTTLRLNTKLVLLQASLLMALAFFIVICQGDGWSNVMPGELVQGSSDEWP